MSYIKTIKEAREEIENFRVFNAGSLTANWEALDGSVGMGSDYVVRSYGVEIGRYSDRKATVHPDAYHHSSTTSKHTTIMRDAWSWFFERQEEEAKRKEFIDDHFKVIMVS